MYPPPVHTWFSIALIAAGPPAVPAVAPVEAAASTPWIRRHAPTPHAIELGVAFGALFPSSHHRIINDVILVDSAGMFYQRYNPFVTEFGLRAAYFPLAFLGVEAEGTIAPTYTQELKERANLFGLRGQLIAHLLRRSVTPYVVAGGGMMSTRGALGTDRDGILHFGAGGKVFVNDRLVIRVELRDNLASGYDRRVVHHVQFAIGLSLRIDPRRRAPTTTR
jgi:hypothetical protein